MHLGRLNEMVDLDKPTDHLAQTQGLLMNTDDPRVARLITIQTGKVAHVVSYDDTSFPRGVGELLFVDGAEQVGGGAVGYIDAPGDEGSGELWKVVDILVEVESQNHGRDPVELMPRPSNSRFRLARA